MDTTRHIQIVFCRLTGFAKAWPNALLYLNDQELSRHERFYFDEHRAAFVASRVLLKECLSQRLGCSPQALQFVQGPQGKPALDPAAHPEALTFNLSHSDTFALLAMDSAPLGVDTENLQRHSDIVKIARHQFHPSEVAQLEAAPDPQRWGIYYWMLKEAYIKYLGTGLSQSLKAFAFKLTPPELQFITENPALIEPQTRLYHFAPEGVCALCMAPGPVSCSFYELLPHAGLQARDAQMLAASA
jgi:4'-phosphopantetheinyl transferase